MTLVNHIFENLLNAGDRWTLIVPLAGSEIGKFHLADASDLILEPDRWVKQVHLTGPTTGRRM